MKKIIMMGIVLFVLSSCGTNIQQQNSSLNGNTNNLKKKKENISENKISDEKLKKANIQMKEDMKETSEKILNNEISEDEALDQIINSMNNSVK